MGVQWRFGNRTASNEASYHAPATFVNVWKKSPVRCERGGVLIIFGQQDRRRQAISLGDDPKLDAGRGTIGGQEPEAIFQGLFILLAVGFLQVAPIAGDVPQQTRLRSLCGGMLGAFWRQGLYVPTESLLTRIGWTSRPRRRTRRGLISIPEPRLGRAIMGWGAAPLPGTVCAALRPHRAPWRRVKSGNLFARAWLIAIQMPKDLSRSQTGAPRGPAAVAAPVGNRQRNERERISNRQRIANPRHVAEMGGGSRGRSLHRSFDWVSSRVPPARKMMGSRPYLCHAICLHE